MAMAEQPNQEPDFGTLPIFNPLQSSHSHMYLSQKSQQRQWPKEAVDAERVRRRTSQNVGATQDSNGQNIRPRASHYGLFGLFSRNKTPEIKVPESKLEVQWEGEEDGGEIQKRDTEVSCPSPHAYIPPPNSGPPPETQNTPLRHRASRRALKTKESFARQKHTMWQPPPLFQAYPQSIRHAKLSSPNAPAETIIRLSQERQRASAKEASAPDDSVRAKKQKEKKLKKASSLYLLGHRDWIEKVFVLATEGYLLQYSGNGNYDRSPERILPLCKDTAAFASDVLPGKPFVLQVSQISEKDGSVNQDSSREMLKKAGLKNEAKLASATILLVLSGPEDMNAWLVAVRKEIEASGGKEYRPEVFGAEGLEEHQKADTTEKLHRMPSHRYLVKREPHSATQKTWEPFANVTLEKHLPEAETAPAAKDLETPTSVRHSRKTRDSIASLHTSDTAASIDQIQLDRLRESPRQSNSSTAAKTG